jgi:hypothetical protein
MLLAGWQFWLGPARAGQLVRFWADCDLIHVFLAGTRIKTIRSHLSVNDLARLIGQGAVNAGPSALPSIEDGEAVEVERVVSKDGLVSSADTSCSPRRFSAAAGSASGSSPPCCCHPVHRRRHPRSAPHHQPGDP